VNATKEYVQGRALVVEGMTLPPEALADARVTLKDLAASIATA
jgi:3-phenylpropionate/trans-cinnamate dioxygenase ferredoxin reductase component